MSNEAAALLIEVRAESATLLEERMNAALSALAGIITIEPAAFSTDPATCEMYWKVRKGAFPSVGAIRRTGTTVITEDVAFPVESLAAATLDLQALLRQHGYTEAVIFGHALEGNLHFVFTQNFSDPAEIARYARFTEEVCRLVVDKYDGSLKAEHGTGRLPLYDFHEFARDALLPRLRITRKPGPVALHVNCSVRRTGSDAKLRSLIEACVDQVVEPAGVLCCGFAGDRGFVVPELNVHALRSIHEALPKNCREGISTNRTCEIGLAAETGRPYHSIAYLLEECSRPDIMGAY